MPKWLLSLTEKWALFEGPTDRKLLQVRSTCLAVLLSGGEDDWEIDFDFVDPEAKDSILHGADSAGDFIDIADERHMDLTEFVNALKATRLPELQKLAEDIEKAQVEQESDE